MAATQLFSKTYSEARSRFIDAALAQGFDISSHMLPITGPEGEELAMDFAVGGPADADSAQSLGRRKRLDDLQEAIGGLSARAVTRHRSRKWYFST